MTIPTHDNSVTMTSGRWQQYALRAENLILALSLAAMVLLPLIEIVLRSVSSSGITAGPMFVQHLTLFVGMLGGAVAAREKRLLALTSATLLLKRRGLAVVTVFTQAVAATVTLFLLIASVTLVHYEREGGLVLAYGLHTWVLQLVMPVGFALITLRLWWHASDRWLGRFIALVLIAVIAGAAIYLRSESSPIDPERLIWPALMGLFLATALGAPVFTALAGTALILYWGQGRAIASISNNHYSLVTNPTLPAIPLFTLAGYFLAEGGASKRLINVFEALVGRIRGGDAVVCVVVCAFFTSFTGASGVTILALGGLLMPILRAAHYREKNILGLLTSSGSLGLLFAPCLPLILYAIIAQNAITLTDFGLDVEVPDVTMQHMFLGGLLPGLLLVTITAVWGIWLAGKQEGGKKKDPVFIDISTGRALWEAKWELCLPIVALGSLFSGKATAVESAALTAAYAFFTQAVVHRELKIGKNVVKVIAECGLLVGGVLLILGVAMGLTKFLIFEDVPMLALEWITTHIQNRYVFLLCLNIFLLIVGCLMDIFSALIVIVPLIIPVGVAFGIDPVHLGIIFLANLELGYMTPPVGLNLFLASYRFNKPLPVIYKAVLPILGLQLIGVLLITYIPWITTFLPNLLR
ncbi:TRAP transporter large permease subunit [Planctomycetota bacterium]